VVLHNLLHSKG